MLVLIAAAAETEKGIEGLFKSGFGEGRKEMPDFGKYIPQNVMSCFLTALPNLFADKKYWYLKEKPFEYFVSTLKKFKDRRKQLFVAYVLMMDETMIGWIPKITKLGLLPHITSEPRKPKSLGTMLRDSCEATTGMFENVFVFFERQKMSLTRF